MGADVQHERFGTRDLSYSAFHRAASIRRFVGWERAQLLSLCDVDTVLWLEYHHGSKAPLALLEVAMDCGQDVKPATAITLLAKRARLPAYVVLYRKAATPNPADPRWRDVSAFRVKRLWPKPERTWRTLTPAEFASGLLKIREFSATRLDIEAANDTKY